MVMLCSFSVVYLKTSFSAWKGGGHYVHRSIGSTCGILVGRPHPPGKPDSELGVPHASPIAIEFPGSKTQLVVMTSSPLRAPR
jgi:hypothetical protein